MNKIRRIMSMIVAFSILSSALFMNEPARTFAKDQTGSSANIEMKSDKEIAESFKKGINDPELEQFVKDNLYANLEESLPSDDYIINDISVNYRSQEYLEEYMYNSQKNIYYGYTLAEIEEQFGDKEFYFTVDDQGKTVVRTRKEGDNTYEQVIKNVAIGAGVILVCATVSIISGGVGAPETVTIFLAESAESGVTLALSTAAIHGTISGIVTGIKTGDFAKSKKAALLGASKGFKWGALAGVATKGLDKALNSVSSIPSFAVSEQRVLKRYGGKSQLSFLKGKEVEYGLKSASRPDIVRNFLGKKEAIEVKNYNLYSSDSCNSLYAVLKRQVSQRVKDLPEGYTQRIVLDVKGRGYPRKLVESVVNRIKEYLMDVYPNIPVDVMWF